MGRHDSMGRHKACPYDVIIVDDHGIVARQGLAAFQVTQEKRCLSLSSDATNDLTTDSCLLTLTPDRGPGQAATSPFIEGEGLSTIFPPRSREGIKGRGSKRQ
jgi:hypothetical protein